MRPLAELPASPVRADAVSAAPPRSRRAPVAALWRAPGFQGDFVLDLERSGPALVPVSRGGASVVSALLEALDEAVRPGKDVIEVRRGDVCLTVDRPADWPAPGRAPSETLAGRAGSRPVAPDAGEGAGQWRLVARARTALGVEGIDRMRELSRRRRALTDERRAAERRYWRLDAAVRARRGKAAAFLAVALAGLACAAFFSLVGAGEFTASSALLFVLGAVGVAFESVTGKREAQRRSLARAELSASMQSHDALDAEVRELTTPLGIENPWALAEHLEALTEEDRRGARPDPDDEGARGVARRLAELLELDPATLEQSPQWAAAPLDAADSWPADVAVGPGPGEAGAALVGMARLLHRVQCDLPPPWPVVLWDPWNNAAPEDRARRLMAFATLAEGRAVIAVARV